MRYRIEHITRYAYSAPMIDGYTLTHLLPRPTAWQDVISAEVVIDPEADECDERTDLFGNSIVHFGLHRPHDTLTVIGRSEVEVAVPVLPEVTLSWEDAVVATANISGAEALDVAPFLGPSTHIEVPVSLSASPTGARTGALARAIHDLTAPAFLPGADLLDVVRHVCRTIFDQFTFDPSFSDVSTPISDVVAAGRGVCQDFAHLAIACLRTRGLAARYVSGYIETEPPPGQERLVGADASHAWCAVWIPGWGWLDLDPTNDHLPARRHVTVAWGRDYADVAPVRGVVIGPAASQELEVAVDVQRISP